MEQLEKKPPFHATVIAILTAVTNKTLFKPTAKDKGLLEKLEETGFGLISSNEWLLPMIHLCQYSHIPPDHLGELVQAMIKLAAVDSNIDIQRSITAALLSFDATKEVLAALEDADDGTERDNLATLAKMMKLQIPEQNPVEAE